MAINVGTAYIEILPSTNKLAPAIREELGKVKADRDGKRAGEDFGSGFKGAVGGMLKGGLLAGIAGASLLGGAGLKTAAELEQSAIGFETMLGSAKAAEKFMAQIKATAAETPFELPGLTSASQKLLAFGFDVKEVIPTLTTLGDAASGLGLGQEGMDRIIMAVGQIQAKGKVQGDELLQLTEAGIPAQKILQNELGLTTDEYTKMQAAGKLVATDAIPALLNGIKHGTKGLAGETAGFGGLMSKQAQSMSGLFSTLKDTVLVGMADALEPLIPTIKDGLGGAIEGAAAFMPKLGSGLKEASKWVAPMVDLTTNVFGWMKDNAAVVGTFAGIILGVAAAVKAWAIGTALLNAVLAISPLTWVTLAVAGLAAGLVYAYKHSETFRRIVNGAWDGIKKGAAAMWSVIKPVLTQFGHWIKDELMPTLRDFWTGVAKPVFKAIGAAAKVMWDRAIKPALKAMWSYLKNVLFPVLKFLWANVVKPVFKAIGSAISLTWKNLIKPAFTRMGSTVRGLVAAFRFAKDGITRVWSALKASVAKPVNFVINTVWNDGLRKVINAIPGVKDLGKARGIPGYAEGGWTGPGGKFTPAGIVHGDEFVINKASRRKFEKKNPGALNYLNNHGELPGYSKGGLVWPTTGHMVSTYAGHDGVDINGPGEDYGQPIFAFRDGTISYVGSGRGYGAPAIFQRTSVGEVVYGHASSASVRSGQYVKAGQVIGRVGSTGNSSGPHLHFGFPGGTYGSALAALSGATTKHGGAEALIGGQSKSTWLDTIKALPGLVKNAWTSSKQIGSSPWAKTIGKAVPSMFRDVAKYADDKIPDAGILPDNPLQSVLKKFGIFDNGGILEPGMLAFNASKKPEAVYNHKQFKQFAEASAGAGNRRQALTITNWKDGTGYIEDIAGRVVDSNDMFSSQIGRMR